MTDRRDFIKLTGILSAGLLLAPEIIIGASNKPRAVVIGAGFSGLAAARMLRMKGMEVTVLEARNRIGGRVFTHTIDQEENLTVELGAEWVGASHTRIQELCKEYNITLLNHQFDTHLTYQGKYYKPSEWSYSETWNKKLAEIFKKFPALTPAEQKKMDKQDWWRFLVNNGMEQRDLDIREIFDSTDFGESIRHVSGFAALSEYAESSPKNEMDFRIMGGNGKLAEAMSKTVGMENIKLSTRVSRVVQSGKTVKVYAGDTVYEAEHVICCLPTFAMSKISWEPGLSEERIDAINALQYARIIKNSALFSERFWNDESFDMGTDIMGHYYFHSTKNQPGKKGVLTSYTIGDKADVIGKQNEQYRKDVVAKGLEPAFGNQSSKIIKVAGYYWGNDEFSRGAYACYGADQWFKIRPILAENHQRVHFAGEHIADWQGFMEGAIETGEAAAETVLREAKMMGKAKKTVALSQ
ncbi:MAG: flavin monoamine oxidase family protein [Cytophagaceae bacterium]